LTAPAPADVFDFSDVSFGADTIVGFDPTRDAIRIATGQAGSYAAIQADISSAGGGTLITLDANRSIILNGVAPTSLTTTNFHFT
jgi:hypothetical protein